MPEKLYKAVAIEPIEIKEEGDAGIITSLVAVIGNIDHGGMFGPPDRIMPGAFSKTIQENFANLRVLDMHRSDSTSRVIGRPLELQEIGRTALPEHVRERFPDATGALLAKTKFNLNRPLSRDVFIQYRDGDLDQWSIGFSAIKTDTEEVNARSTQFGYELDADAEPMEIRNLREIRLFEYSAVIWGMNEATTTIDAMCKSRNKRVVPMQNFPLAPRGRAWDAAAARERLRSWAGGEDDTDFGKFRRGFMWYDAENADVFGAYKLPYVDVIDGEPNAIFRGISAGAGRLEQSDIPDADKGRIKGIINRWYARARDEFDDDEIVSPFEEGASQHVVPDIKADEKEPAEKAAPEGVEDVGAPEPFVQPLGDQLAQAINAIVNQLGDEWFKDGLLTPDERISISEIGGNIIGQLAISVPTNIKTKRVPGRVLKLSSGNAIIAHTIIQPDKNSVAPEADKTEHIPDEPAVPGDTPHTLPASMPQGLQVDRMLRDLEKSK